MVDLPRHVHRVKKVRAGGNAVVYTFYTRHRNQPGAWPSILLPDPMTADFAFRADICAALDRDAEGFLLHGKRLPDHKAPAFWKEAEAARAAHVSRQHRHAKDFTALIDAFTADTNPKWSALSKSTRRGYKASAAMMKEAWAFDLPDDLTTVDAQEAVDALGETPASANQFRAFGSRLFSWGIPRGFAKGNPFADTEKIDGGEPWKPWPEWAFEIHIANAPPHLLFPSISAIFTGQRQGDVLMMKKPKPTEGLIEVRAQKTKNTVWIPIHSEYRKWLEKMPASDSVQLHVGEKGLPYKSADSFRSGWDRLMNTAPYRPFKEERIVFHGLRKNAVIFLLEAGCNEEMVGAICNMSPEMVRHYGREVSLRRLAKMAMAQMETWWTEHGPAALKVSGGNGNGT
jgi:hypothetical protein